MPLTHSCRLPAAPLLRRAYIARVYYCLPFNTRAHTLMGSCTIKRFDGWKQQRTAAAIVEIKHAATKMRRLDNAMGCNSREWTEWTQSLRRKFGNHHNNAVYLTFNAHSTDGAVSPKHNLTFNLYNLKINFKVLFSLLAFTLCRRRLLKRFIMTNDKRQTLKCTFFNVVSFYSQIEIFKLIYVLI